jgi:hypothetical protein
VLEALRSVSPHAFPKKGAAGFGVGPDPTDFPGVGAFALLTGKRPREARLRWRGSAERGPSCAPGAVQLPRAHFEGVRDSVSMLDREHEAAVIV